MAVEYQYEIRPFGSGAWELLQDWTEDGSIEAPGYPDGITGYRVRDRDTDDPEDISDWVEFEVTRTAAESVSPSVPPAGLSGQEIFVGDYGTLFRFACVDGDSVPLPLELASMVDVVFRLPDRSTLRRALAVAYPEGLAVYYAAEGELSVAGRWSVQGIFETPDGLWHSRVQHFRVHANIPENEVA